MLRADSSIMISFRRYIIDYMVGNLVLQRPMSFAMKLNFLFPDDIPPQMNILNMVIPILMHFCLCLPYQIFISFQIKALQAA